MGSSLINKYFLSTCCGLRTVLLEHVSDIVHLTLPFNLCLSFLKTISTAPQSVY